MTKHTEQPPEDTFVTVRKTVVQLRKENALLKEENDILFAMLSPEKQEEWKTAGATAYEDAYDD